MKVPNPTGNPARPPGKVRNPGRMSRSPWRTSQVPRGTSRQLWGTSRDRRARLEIPGERHEILGNLSKSLGNAASPADRSARSRGRAVIPETPPQSTGAVPQSSRTGPYDRWPGRGAGGPQRKPVGEGRVDGRGAFSVRLEPIWAGPYLGWPRQPRCSSPLWSDIANPVHPELMTQPYQVQSSR